MDCSFASSSGGLSAVGALARAGEPSVVSMGPRVGLVAPGSLVAPGELGDRRASLSAGRRAPPGPSGVDGGRLDAVGAFGVVGGERSRADARAWNASPNMVVRAMSGRRSRP